jgi:hypothetical protein
MKDIIAWWTILKWNFRKMDGIVCIGFVGLRLQTSDRLL